jgi:hypothetical protein
MCSGASLSCEHSICLVYLATLLLQPPCPSRQLCLLCEQSNALLKLAEYACTSVLWIHWDLLFMCWDFRLWQSLILAPWSGLPWDRRHFPQELCSTCPLYNEQCLVSAFDMQYPLGMRLCELCMALMCCMVNTSPMMITAAACIGLALISAS